MSLIDCSYTYTRELASPVILEWDSDAEREIAEQDIKMAERVDVQLAADRAAAAHAREESAAQRAHTTAEMDLLRVRMQEKKRKRDAAADEILETRSAHGLRKRIRDGSTPNAAVSPTWARDLALAVAK